MRVVQWQVVEARELPPDSSPLVPDHNILRRDNAVFTGRAGGDHCLHPG